VESKPTGMFSGLESILSNLNRSWRIRHLHHTYEFSVEPKSNLMIKGKVAVWTECIVVTLCSF
jgi:hypothetical protein